MTQPLTIFAYGSLLASPELPEVVTGPFPARLEGYRRSFNKRSVARGCRPAEALELTDESWQPPPLFRAGDLHCSLVLGAVEDPAASLIGGVLEYPVEVADHALRAIDRREGAYAKHKPSRALGYVRMRHAVHRLDTGERQETFVYVSNPRPNDWLVPPEMSVEERARILFTATPRTPPRRALGMYYLEEVRAALLAAGGIIDPELEELADTARGLAEAAQEILSAPRTGAG